MSAPDDRPIFDWRECVSLLIQGPASPADAMRKGVYDLDCQVFTLRALGVEVTLKGGRYAIPKTDANVDRLHDLLLWAEGRQHG